MRKRCSKCGKFVKELVSGFADEEGYACEECANEDWDEFYAEMTEGCNPDDEVGFRD